MTVFKRAVLLIAAASFSQAAAQGGASTRDSVRVRRGSEMGIPLASALLPGLGQYIHGAPAQGLAYTSVYVTGLAAYLNHPADTTDFPRSGDSQVAGAGVGFAATAGWLSGWDAFHRAVPAMQQRGKYGFLPKREGIPDLLSAPFDYRFFGRWTTWADLALTGAISGLVLSTREANQSYYPLRAQDAAFSASISANAGIGEEAFFRGYLLPMLYQKTGQKFWVANATQAALFGIGHGPAGLLFQGPWGLWEGWLVRRNNWSIRESIFHHVWYDFAVVTAAAVSEEKPVTVRLRLPTITF